MGFLCWIGGPQLAFRKQIPYVLHFWTGAPSCYLELLDKLQKQIYRTVGPSLAASLEPLTHHQNVASLSLFYRYCFARCSSELAQLIPLPLSCGRSTCYSDRLHDFSITIPKCYKNVYSFFPRIVRLWNSLSIECFPMTYDLNDFKCRTNKHLLTVGSFWRNFLYVLIFLCFFFLQLHALQWLFSLAWSESQFLKKAWPFCVQIVQSSIKVCIKQALASKNWMILDKVLRIYYLKIPKKHKNLKKLKIPLTGLSKKTFFEVLKLVYLHNCLSRFKK